MKTCEKQKEEEQPYDKLFTGRELKAAIKQQKKYSTWRAYYSSSDDIKQTTTRDTEVFASNV